jgi:hypothetical protein
MNEVTQAAFHDELEKISGVKDLFAKNYVEAAEGLTDEEKEKLKAKLPLIQRYGLGAVPFGVGTGALIERGLAPKIIKGYKPSVLGTAGTMAALGLGYHLGTRGEGAKKRLGEYYKKKLEE